MKRYTIVKNLSGYGDYKGQPLTITENHNSNFVTVKDADGNYWYCYGHELKEINETEPATLVNMAFIHAGKVDPSFNDVDAIIKFAGEFDKMYAGTDWETAENDWESTMYKFYTANWNDWNTVTWHVLIKA